LTPAFKLFKVDASRRELRVGDDVIPEKTVAEDFETRKSVRAGCNGVVEAVN
jgi:hypothetical protein